MKIDLYERIILGLTVVMLLVFIGALATATLAAGIHVPGQTGRIAPDEIAKTEPFSNPGLRELGPGRYEAVMVAQMWGFTPSEITVPVGARVNFRIVSRDVTHGFNIEGTNANVMLVPGQISQVEVLFNRPGEQLIICHEYCGTGHHLMWGRVIVK
ncbi:MAG: cytochrome c oxidase subunit II [Chloroflexi bacterium]|nr:cytochrome c oxidase subunit II [Chloroflexota bacterium]